MGDLRGLIEAVEAELPPAVELWMVRDALNGMAASDGLTTYQKINARFAAGVVSAILRALEAAPICWSSHPPVANSAVHDALRAGQTVEWNLKTGAAEILPKNVIRRLQQAADILEDTTAVALVRREDLVVAITAIREIMDGEI